MNLIMKLYKYILNNIFEGIKLQKIYLNFNIK